MAQEPGAKLYSPELLMLAVSLAEHPMQGEYAHTASARSRTCGSTMTIGLDCDDEGRVRRFGTQVSACAVGQASAAIMVAHLEGASLRQIRETHDAIADWLAGDAPLPDWPGFVPLEPAKAHRGRHEALLLPWKAAMDALSSDAARG